MRTSNHVEQEGTLTKNADSRISGTLTEYPCTCGKKNMVTHDSMCRGCWDRLSATKSGMRVIPATSCRSIPQ